MGWEDGYTHELRSYIFLQEAPFLFISNIYPRPLPPFFSLGGFYVLGDEARMDILCFPCVCWLPLCSGEFELSSMLSILRMLCLCSVISSLGVHAPKFILYIFLIRHILDTLPIQFSLSTNNTIYPFIFAYYSFYILFTYIK